ncbi:S-methyl-5-thioribose-1-phosphate isomerase [Gammaproteobacteria bacterium 45_16_T64]|nr:S-methyl-5-thioribose-1-phosphate isomerase [Gammaproteobacteria bacterium 45_16_T64]
MMSHVSGVAESNVIAIEWKNDQLYLLDQRVLPQDVTWISHATVGEVVGSIKNMVVRGAPAIGIAAAYGVVLSARARYQADPMEWRKGFEEDMDTLANSRPTAVNLCWAIDRLSDVCALVEDGENPESALLAAAIEIHQSDLAANHAMGQIGAEVIKGESEAGICVMTHCNAGALATGGYGTALGVIRSAHALGMIKGVYADETRPWLQGARLTCWELQQDNVPVALNIDGAAAQLMATGQIGWVIVGADRITANGDVANKIGTYGLAVLAQYHGVKVMVVAPTTTIDMALFDGEDIPIEERDASEVTELMGAQIAPQGTDAINPVFDVTPANLIDVIVTERGAVRAPFEVGIAAIMSKQNLH